jgi:hypothetical protein
MHWTGMSAEAGEALLNKEQRDLRSLVEKHTSAT